MQPSAQSAGPGDYLWKVYEFHAPGNLRIQVCAQAFSASQNKSMIGLDQPDVLRIRVDDVIPSDAWEVQSGPPGRAQWDGAKDQGKRTTLEFLVTGLQPGRHALSFHAWGCPIIYWIKVSDLEHR